MTIPEIKVVLGEDERSSTYRLKGSRTVLSFSEACAVLMSKYGLTYEEAPEALTQAFNSAANVEEEGDEYYIPELSDTVVALFMAFRWFSNPDGTWAIFVKNSPYAETYVFTSDPMTTASAITWPSEDGDKQTLEDAMTKYYKQWAVSGKLPFIGKNSSEEKTGKRKPLPTIAEYWETHIKELWRRDSRFRLESHPTEISTDPNVPAFFFFNPDQLVEGPHPNWDLWMNCIPEFARETFMAWIYSIFDPHNRGRQALWLHDQGYSGKSSMFRALANFLGTHAVGSIGQGSLDNQFGYSTVYGKRLAIYGDCTNAKLLHKEKIRNILGADLVPIERKNQQPFMAPVHVKLAIAANIAAEVDLGSRAELTRICYVPMIEPPEHILAQYCMTDGQGRVMRRKADNSPYYIGGDLESKLTPEVPHFLFSCKPIYEKLCPNHSDIALSDEMWEALQAKCPSPEHMGVERFVEEELEIGPEYAVPPGEMQEALSLWSKGKSNSFDFTRLRTYLETKHGVSLRDRTRTTGRLLTGVRIRSVGRPKGGLKV